MRNLLAGWKTQARTIQALMVRDLMMRYGRDNLGFGWVILEPMILTVGVMAIWTAMGYQKSGIKAVEMVLTGYMPLTLWRHLTNNFISIYRNSVGMLYHRRVTPLDLVLSRQFLEIIATSAALLVIYSSLILMDMIQGVERLDLLLLGWFMMAWAGMAFGMWIAGVTEKYEVAERFVQPLQYLNIPISGAFFFVDWLPHWAQNLILLHPLVHCYEVFRAGYFGEAIVSHYNLGYFTACVTLMTFIGLRSVNKARSYIRLN